MNRSIASSPSGRAAAVLGIAAIALAAAYAVASAEQVPILFECTDESGNYLPGIASVRFDYYAPPLAVRETPFVLDGQEGDALYVTFTCYGRSVTMLGKHVVPDVAVLLVATGPPGTDHREPGEVVPGMMRVQAVFRPLPVSVIGMDSLGGEVSVPATVQVGEGPAVSQDTSYEITACNGSVVHVVWDKKRPEGPYSFVLQEGTSFICDFTGKRNDWTQALVESPGVQEIVLVVRSKAKGRSRSGR